MDTFRREKGVTGKIFKAIGCYGSDLFLHPEEPDGIELQHPDTNYINK